MRTWFVNYAGSAEAAKKKSEGGKKIVAGKGSSKKTGKKEKALYILRDVIADLHADRVEEETKLLCDDAPKGSPTWLGAFSKGVAKVRGMLTTSEMQEVEDTLETWNRIGAPNHIKAL